MQIYIYTHVVYIGKGVRVSSLKFPHFVLNYISPGAKGKQNGYRTKNPKGQGLFDA